MGDDCPAVGRQIGRAPVTPLVSFVDVLCTVTLCHLCHPCSTLHYHLCQCSSWRTLCSAKRLQRFTAQFPKGVTSSLITAQLPLRVFAQFSFIVHSLVSTI